jgi:hypothetical protein
MTTNQPFELTDEVRAADEVYSKDGVVILQPIAMRIPNTYNIYFPSKLEEKKTVRYEEFLARYSDQPKRIRICFDETSSIETMRQRSKLVTAYSCGLDCWYVIVS